MHVLISDCTCFVALFKFLFQRRFKELIGKDSNVVHTCFIICNEKQYLKFNLNVFAQNHYFSQGLQCECRNERMEHLNLNFGIGIGQ